MRTFKPRALSHALVLALAMALIAGACGRAPAGGAKNVLKWTTRWEKGHQGFEIYRSTTPDGPREKITAQPVPPAPDAAAGHVYVYEDVGIDPTRAYTYTIEVIDADGQRHPLSTIQSKPKAAKVQ